MNNLNGKIYTVQCTMLDCNQNEYEIKCQAQTTRSTQVEFKLVTLSFCCFCLFPRLAAFKLGQTK